MSFIVFNWQGCRLIWSHLANVNKAWFPQNFLATSPNIRFTRNRAMATQYYLMTKLKTILLYVINFLGRSHGTIEVKFIYRTYHNRMHTSNNHNLWKIWKGCSNVFFAIAFHSVGCDVELFTVVPQIAFSALSGQKARGKHG